MNSIRFTVGELIVNCALTSIVLLLGFYIYFAITIRRGDGYRGHHLLSGWLERRGLQAGRSFIASLNRKALWSSIDFDSAQTTFEAHFRRIPRLPLIDNTDQSISMPFNWGWIRAWRDLGQADALNGICRREVFQNDDYNAGWLNQALELSRSGWSHSRLDSLFNQTTGEWVSP
jgi:hypothetical protein